MTITTRFNGRDFAYHGKLLERDGDDEGFVHMMCRDTYTKLPLGTIEGWWEEDRGDVYYQQLLQLGFDNFDAFLNERQDWQ